MPVLARTIEAAGIPTVEFPFGQAFGMIDDLDMQREVAEAAVQMLADATQPETRRDLDIEWPIDTKTAYRAWQPAEISPFVKMNLEAIRKNRRESAS